MTARDTIAAFLKVRDENVTPDECDDQERADSADAILEALAAANVQQARIVREAVADLFIAADLLHERWKAQSKAVSRRLVEHAENLQGVLAGLSALTAAGFTIVGPADMEKAAEAAISAYNRSTGYAFPQATDAEQQAAMRAALTAASPHMPAPAGLVEFAKEMCRVGFDGGSIDGCDILDTAVEHGLCTVTQYHSGMTGIANSEYFEEGDAVYVFSGPLSSRPKGGA